VSKNTQLLDYAALMVICEFERELDKPTMVAGIMLMGCWSHAAIYANRFGDPRLQTLQDHNL
jgi:hypothetical protein